MKIKSKGGPDSIPPVFLKKCISSLSSPLSYIFQLSFTSGFLPDDWRRAYITPIYKKSDSTNPCNYRPIALTCNICKLMESIIKDQLLSFLFQNNIITKHQHAFIARHSTATNLLESVHDWSLELNSSHCIDSVYIDFSRAFDSIVFSKLLYKLEHYGIRGNLLNWIGAFLSDRNQCVVLENTFSYVCRANSGVPQGSVLGPILFLIFINDLVLSCGDNSASNNCVLKLFADDLKLHTVVNTDSSSVILQRTLDNIYKWSVDWQLGMNISKCCVISINNGPHIINTHRYFINNNSVENCRMVSDLGIKIDSHLTFKDHINDISSRATQRVGILFRGFSSRNLKLLRTAFVTYIRPLLEYNSTVWSPIQKYLINIIEKVQRSFTKRIPSLSNLSYADRLKQIGLEPLELRRLKFVTIKFIN